MGATIGHLIGGVFRRNWPDCWVLVAGAGAVLAPAFDAPIAGSIFVLEELVRRFELRVKIAALGASATTISMSRLLLGDAADFRVEALICPGAATPFYFVIGAAANFVAGVYNRLLLATIATTGRLNRWRGLRAALIGAAIGVLA
jgi:CIC family chloride channel protein